MKIHVMACFFIGFLDFVVPAPPGATVVKMSFDQGG